MSQRRLVMPDGMRLDFGFSIIARDGTGKKPVLLWDEDLMYNAQAKPAETVEITSPLGLTETGVPAYIRSGDLVPMQIEYLSKEAAVVNLDWGNKRLELASSGPATAGRNSCRRYVPISMRRERDVFKATAWAPRRSTLNLGF